MALARTGREARLTATRNAEKTQGQATLPEMLTGQILTYLREQGFSPGNHIPAQRLADFLGVSRSPVSRALEILEEHGQVRREPKRGYFLDRDTDKAELLGQESAIEATYFQIAEDCLNGEIPVSVSEAMLKSRYGVSQGALNGLLSRMLREGWIEPRKGYGWRFSTMLTTADALMQTYQLRLALEPAALIEPTFHIHDATLDRLEETERRLLAGDIETISARNLYEAGVLFHETLAQASGNPYIFDALHRVNQVRRLIAYRSMIQRERYYKQAEQHLEILMILRHGQRQQAADAMRHHLNSVILNLRFLDATLTKASGDTARNSG